MIKTTSSGIAIHNRKNFEAAKPPEKHGGGVCFPLAVRLKSRWPKPNLRRMFDMGEKPLTYVFYALCALLAFQIWSDLGLLFFTHPRLLLLLLTDGWVWLTLGALGVTYYMRNAQKKGEEPLPTSGTVAADYGVPHVSKFEQTPEGFTVSFNKLPVGFAKFFASQNEQNSKGAIAALVGLVFMLIGGIVAIVYKLVASTKIEVKRDTIEISGKTLSRPDFGGFSVGNTYQVPGHEETLAVLSYSYGNRSFPFGGAWSQGEATEVASALNKHLRISAGNVATVSPEKLRDAHVTDF